MTFKRVWKHYSELEEFHYGMYKTVSGDTRKAAVLRAANLLANPEEIRDAMLQVLDDWPASCEVNFTSEGVNKIAWLGQAACCLRVGAPEEPTRAAWFTLSQLEQRRANEAAIYCISKWEAAYKAIHTQSLFDAIGETHAA